MDNVIRLIIDAEPRSGAWNMAADEVLLESALTSESATVRIYRWEIATVSLGYFQDADDFRASNRFRDLPAVRRLSGGGAILHHHELTYSLALSPGQPAAENPTDVYRAVHDGIIRQLAAAGIEAGMRGTDASLPDEPFLCFIRGDRHDILCRDHKIVGSAQRRRRGAVLQHGSLILQTSPYAEEIPGCLDLVPEARLPNKFDVLLGSQIANCLGEPVQIIDWTDEELGTIRDRKRQYLSIDRT